MGTPEYKVRVYRESDHKNDPGYEHWYADVLHYGLPSHISNGEYTYDDKAGRPASGWFNSEADAKRAGDKAIREAKKAAGGGTARDRNVRASNALLRRF